MRATEILFAIACAMVGAGIAFGLRALLGEWPSPVFYYAMIVIGLGIALVIVRYGRLGPYDGEFGPPRLEADLRERMMRETERAVRYGRDLTVLAVRQESGQPVSWNAHVRTVDAVVACRKGVTLLLLPETSRDGALLMLRRVSVSATTMFHAALVSAPADGRTGDDLSMHLLRLVRQSTKPGHVALRTHGAVETLPISA